MSQGPRPSKMICIIGYYMLILRSFLLDFSRVPAKVFYPAIELIDWPIDQNSVIEVD